MKNCCPNSSCGEELSLHQCDGYVEKNCHNCGYEGKEENGKKARREVAMTPVISLSQKRTEKKVKLKAKQMNDRANYVPQRGMRG